MLLQIIGKPSMVSAGLKNKVIVEYDAEAEITTVTCDIDVVTLGIAVKVLQAQYDQILAELEPYVAVDIEETIRKAVWIGGQNSSKNTQSSSNC